MGGLHPTILQTPTKLLHTPRMGFLLGAIDETGQTIYNCSQTYGGLAQLGERLAGSQKVIGSSPLSSIGIYAEWCFPKPLTALGLRKDSKPFSFGFLRPAAKPGNAKTRKKTQGRAPGTENVAENGFFTVNAMQ